MSRQAGKYQFSQNRYYPEQLNLSSSPKLGQGDSLPKSSRAFGRLNPERSNYVYEHANFRPRRQDAGA